jgi:VCBS repeat protein
MHRVAARILTAAAGLLASGNGAAQPVPYRDVTATHLPDGIAGPCMNAAAGDADGDGDLDLALAMEFQPNVLLLNDGKGIFANGSVRLPRTAHDSEDVAFADFDRDGDLDLVLVSEDDRKDELYLNDGAGRFADASDRLVPDDVSNALAVLDLNGDGAPDVLTGNIGVDRALINDGRGNFRDETAQRWPQDGGESRTQDLEVADVDGDGDLDVLVGNEGQDQLYLNAGGRLVDATAGRLPARADETREIRAGDVDGDGDLDLVVGNVRFVLQESAQDYLLLNDGKGVFTTADPARFPEDARSNFTSQLVDLDADGDLDVVAPSTVFPRSAVEFIVVFTDGDGRTAVARGPGFDVRDTDGDGDTDAVLEDGDRRQAFLQEGGRFVAARVDAWVNASVLQDEDITGDNRPDVADVRIPLGALSGQNGSVQVIDLDRDGDVDVLIPATASMDSVGDYLVLLNDGAGRFAAAAPGTVLPATADGNGFDVEIADFDGDGSADLFLCNRASLSRAEDSQDTIARSGGRQRLLLGPSRGTSR